MRAVLFCAITAGRPTQCKSLQDITIGALRSNAEPEDILNFAMDGVQLPLQTVSGLIKTVDYMLFHQMLWARIEANDNINDCFRSGEAIYEKIRHQSTQPPIQNVELAIALGKDMRRAFGTRREIESVLENFDYPSIFVLYVENIPHGAPKVEDVLKGLLDEKLVQWLRDSIAPLDVGMMNVLAHPIGLEYVYKGLSQLDPNSLRWLRHLPYFAAQRLLSYPYTEMPRFLSEVDIGLSFRRRARIAHRVDFAMANNKQGARKLVLALATDFSTSVPFDLLLELRSNVHRWLGEGSLEPLSLKHELFVSNQYLTSMYLEQDLRFLDKYITTKVRSRPIVEVVPIFESPRTLSLLYDVLRGQNSDRLLRCLLRFDFHHLYRLQRACVHQDHDLNSVTNFYLDKDFNHWIQKEWHDFAAESSVLFDPEGVQHVVERMRRTFGMLDITGLDYLSLLLLRNGFVRLNLPVNRYINVITDLLPMKRELFYRRLREDATRVLADSNNVEKLMYVLPLLPEAPFPISELVPFMVENILARQQPSDIHIKSMISLVRRALQSMPSVQAFLNSKRNLEVTLSLMLWLQNHAFQEFHDIMRHLNYNHVLVLRMAYHHRSRRGGIELLRNDVSAYCHELLPHYVIPHMLRPQIRWEVRISLLQEMQYLSLLRLKAEPWLDQEMYHAIENGLVGAKLRWRHWFTRNSLKVLGDKENTKALIKALKIVPDGVYLFTPLQLIQLEASARHFNLKPSKANAQHRKLYFRGGVHRATSDWSVATLFSRYIWQDEDAVDIDNIKLSVWFFNRVKIDKRVAVSTAISWPAVQALKGKYLKSGKRWYPPNGLEKRRTLSRWLTSTYVFLIDDYKNTGLPQDWFDTQ